MIEVKLVVYGALWCPDCDRTKRLLEKYGVAYSFVDTDSDPTAKDFVEQVNDGYHIIPTIIFPDGSMLSEPSDAALAEKLGISPR